MWWWQHGNMFNITCHHSRKRLKLLPGRDIGKERSPLAFGEEVSAHPQRPPVQSAGTFVEDFVPPPDTTSEALAKELASLPCDSPVTDLEIYDTVIAHIAPLGVLRQTVADWKSSLNPATALYEVAENVELVLTPQCVADSVKHHEGGNGPTLHSMPAWPGDVGATFPASHRSCRKHGRSYLLLWL